MSVVVSNQLWRPKGETLRLLIKWLVALLVPVIVFNFLYGEAIFNTVISPETATLGLPTDMQSLIQAALFIAIFYLGLTALAGYLVAADSGRQGIFPLWLDVLIFALVPLLIILQVNDLIIGLASSVVVWGIYILIRSKVIVPRLAPPAVLENLKVVEQDQRQGLLQRARTGGFWFATILALVWFLGDVAFYFSGALTDLLAIVALVRTLLLPVLGYFLGELGGRIALRYVLNRRGNTKADASPVTERVSKRRQLQALGRERAREEAKSLVPNDAPLLSTGAQNFYILLLLAFVVLYPIIDPFLFGSGTNGRIANYADAGRYIILALGLNIVVGFAGLLDLGYVAFFALGAYAWGFIGSGQLAVLTNGFSFDPSVRGWLFWAMILGGALIAAFWGVVLGAPTLRLRGDYLAIVTLGFGEIIPIVFQNLRQYTNGTNGIVGISPPSFFGFDWTKLSYNAYFYLILALIAVVIFANVRLRDSRLGRAWIAIREDEVAAASSGVNLINTKLFAFGAGAFFSGIAGVYYSAKLGTVSSENFTFSDSVIYLAMVVIGGLGSIPGVVVGALAVYSLNELVIARLDVLGTDSSSILFPIYQGIQDVVPGFSFSNIRNLIFGILLVVIVIVRPEGLLPSARRKRELRQEENVVEEDEALEPIPGSPGFETEKRV